MLYPDPNPFLPPEIVDLVLKEATATPNPGHQPYVAAQSSIQLGFTLLDDTSSSPYHLFPKHLIV